MKAGSWDRCPQPCSPPWCQLLLVALKPMLFRASNAILGLGATKAQGVGLGAHDLPLSWLLVVQPRALLALFCTLIP